MATTTLTGTTGNNLLNAPGSVSTLVQGLQGADTINLALANDEAQGGKGLDAIQITRAGVLSNTIFGGDGNDTVSIRSGGQFNGYVDLGAGNDSILIGSAGTTLLNGAQVYGGEGSDTIAIINAITNSTVGAGSGSDLLSFTAANAITSSVVNGGKRSDTITVAAATGSFATIQAGQGNDRLNFRSAGAFANSLVGLGKGSDIATFGRNAVASISGGGLNDTITLISGFAGGAVYGDARGVTTAGTGTDGAADGQDLITVSATITGRTSIWGAGGNDTIRALSGFGGAVTATLIDGGNGADSIFIAGSGGGYGVGTISGGSGNDTIFIGSGSLSASTFTALGTISGGNGVDRIQLAAITSNTATIAGVGTGSFTGSEYYAVISAPSGDTLRTFTSQGFSAGGGATAANWVGNAPTIFVGSTVSAAASGAQLLTTGGIGVWSDGNDSVIAINSGVAADQVSLIVAKGIDLTITTALGAVTLTGTTFRFNVAAVSGGGMDITFA